MTDKQIEDLAGVFESMYKYYKGWAFAYEYPGNFAYCQMGGPLCIFFTPEYDDEPGVVPVQVNHEDGRLIESREKRFAHPENISQELHADELFKIVRPFLEKHDKW